MQQGVEAVRAQFRPPHITTLFVGESAPVSGDFFYQGNTQMLRYMRRAVEAVHGESDDFLNTFKSYGWYLDDLVLTPVNHLGNASRKAMCLAARDSLADRIVQYNPTAIVSLMVAIKEIVEGAAADVGSGARLFLVPFPGNGQQARFHAKMVEILPQLPKL